MKNFSETFCLQKYGPRKGALPWIDVLEHLRKYSHLQTFSGHNIRFPLPQDPDFVFHPVFFIRQPIDRIISIYNMNKRKKDDLNVFSKNAKVMSLNEYIRWGLDYSHTIVFENSQLRILSQHIKDSMEQRLLKTKELIKNTLLVGIVDKFDESMVLFEEYLRPYFSNIDLSYKRQNVDPEREGFTISEKIKKISSKINDSLMNELMEKNSLDIELYNFTLKILNERLKIIPNFQKKLDDFKLRSKLLTEKVDREKKSIVQETWKKKMKENDTVSFFTPC